MDMTNPNYIYIHSNWGVLTINSEGYVLPFESKYNSHLEEDRGQMINGGDALGDIVRFDLQEFRHTYPKDTPRDIDICDIGYWTTDGKYEPPVDDFRQEFCRKGIDREEVPPVKITPESAPFSSSREALSAWRYAVENGDTWSSFSDWLNQKAEEYKKESPSLTQEQLDRQDWVDNGIHGLLEELTGKEVDWDIEDIGLIRDAFKEVIVDRGMIMTEQQFYPFI
ncbi:MAG: hypothetical protein WC291_09845 [Thermodesulfovibrionales bacterium]|jgi:hypothetical protein